MLWFFKPLRNPSSEFRLLFQFLSPRFLSISLNVTFKKLDMIYTFYKLTSQKNEGSQIVFEYTGHGAATSFYGFGGLTLDNILISQFEISPPFLINPLIDPPKVTYVTSFVIGFSLFFCLVIGFSVIVLGTLFRKMGVIKPISKDTQKPVW